MEPRVSEPDVGDPRGAESARCAADRLTRLQVLSETLAVALAPTEVGAAIVREVDPAVGASAGLVCMLDATGDGLAFIGTSGVSVAELETWPRLPLDAGVPLTECVRRAEAIFIEQTDDWLQRYPRAAQSPLGPAGARAALPLQAGGQVLGALGLSFADNHAFDDSERAFLLALARQCALALERARLFAVERRAAERLAFLAEAGELLASSLDIDATLTAVTRLAIAHMADWCIVDMMSEGDVLVRARAAHVDPSFADLLRTLEGVPVEAGDPVARAVRAGHTLHLPVVTEHDWVTSSTSEVQIGLARALTPRSLVAVPLVARGRMLGAVVLASATAWRFGEEEVALAEDLAHRAALALDSAMLLRKAEQAVRLRDEFLAVASHELRTPLTPLRLQLQMLLREAPERLTGERLTERLTMALRQAERLTRLVESLLDVSRITTGRMELLRDDADLGGIVRDVVDRYTDEAARAGCQVSLQIGPALGRWDRLRIEQVVINLLTNAIKYGAGHPVEVTVSRVGVRVSLAVRDHGIGIAPEHQDRIFGQFERAVSVRSYGGLGLGLYIARQIVEAHGGTIRVTSAPGEGSTFVVDLPADLPGDIPTDLPGNGPGG